MGYNHPRMEPLEAFVDCYNICYPDAYVRGSANNMLTTDDVEYSYCTGYYAKAGPRSGENDAFFAINHQEWDEFDSSERIGLLIHELAHIKETSHKPAFWSQVITNYHQLASNPEAVESVFGGVCWNEVKEFLINDPNGNTTDRRAETVFERRTKLADKLDYEGSVEPFEKMRLGYGPIYTDSEWSSEFSVIREDLIEYPRLDPLEAFEAFHERPQTEVKYDSKHWHQYNVRYPRVVRQSDGTYEVVDGVKAANIQYYYNQQPDSKVSSDKLRVVKTDPEVIHRF